MRICICCMLCAFAYLSGMIKNDPDICSSILENDKTNEGVLFAFSNEENTCLAFPQHLKESLVGLE